MELRGKTAVLTGATGGLGSRIVIALADAGCECICIYNKNTEKINQLTANNNRIVGIQADISKKEQIEKVFEQIKKTAAKVNILVNAAAMFEPNPKDRFSDDFINYLFAVNFFAAMNMTEKFAALAEKQNAALAKVVNITDAMANNPSKLFSVYNASKAALEVATKQLACQLAPKITVNAVAPGIVSWPAGCDEKVRQKIISKIPAGRIARPEEIISAVKFLLENDYITGQVITVDGGRWL